MNKGDENKFINMFSIKQKIRNKGNIISHEILDIMHFAFSNRMFDLHNKTQKKHTIWCRDTNKETTQM